MTAVLSTDQIDAVLFDLDGVVTDTARLHAAAWKRLFDAYLAVWAETSGNSQEPFDVQADYVAFVDGKPRYDGVDSFLRSRGIELPWGTPEDPAEAATVCGLGNGKDAIFHSLLAEQGIEVFPGTRRLIGALGAAGVKIALVTSSRNGRRVLAATGITELFDAVVDGNDSAELGLAGKPAPDSYLEAARRLAVPPERCAIVEDAIVGVEAGRNGHFGRVVGVDRGGIAEELAAKGADLVVHDLAEIEVTPASGAATAGRSTAELPSALARLPEILAAAGGRDLVFFLDYDGTLTPIVERPELAVLAEDMRATLKELARRHRVAVISGRDLADVKALVGLEELVYAGSHGFMIAGPGNFSLVHDEGEEFLPVLDRAEAALHAALDGIPGALVERKRMSIASHYRLVGESDVTRVAEAVEQVRAAHPELRKTAGKKVFELQPDIAWDKGAAVLWLLKALGLDLATVLPVFIGDDLTDEDAFRALREGGLGIVVRDAPRQSLASYALDNPDEVRRFFELVIAGGERPGG